MVMQPCPAADHDGIQLLPVPPLHALKAPQQVLRSFFIRPCLRTACLPAFCAVPARACRQACRVCHGSRSAATTLPAVIRQDLSRRSRKRTHTDGKTHASGRTLT